MLSVNFRENEISINGLNINYKTIGNSDTPIVLLHGWGVDSDKYMETAKQLRGLNCKIIIPDLPGFGKSDEPRENWNLDNYVEFVDKFIKKTNRKSGFELVKNILEKKIKQCRQYGNMYYHTVDGNQGKILKRVQNDSVCDNKIILIGHSFGGRIAIKYAVKYPEKINKLILTGAAGIKHSLNIKQKIIFILAKTGKKIFSMFKKANIPIGRLASFSQKFLYKAVKEKDYYNASPRMKEIMKKIIAEDLSAVLPKINIPTLLVWGKFDRTTLLSDGKLMNERIKDSELVVVDGANHSLPYQKPKEFAKIIADFAQKNR